MEVTKFGQAFYRQEADKLYPEGCQCGNNGGGDCDWCQIYYGFADIVDDDSDLEFQQSHAGEADSGDRV
jgi:hypothetical protein